MVIKHIDPTVLYHHRSQVQSGFMVERSICNFLCGALAWAINDKKINYECSLNRSDQMYIIMSKVIN